MNQTRGNNPVSVWTLLALLVAVLAMGMVIVLLFQLQQYRVGTANLLQNMSTQLNNMTQKDVEYTVKVDQTIPFAVEVPINQELSVPVKFELNDTFPLDATIPMDTQLNLPVNTTIPVNQTFNAALNVLGQNISLPVSIQGNLPINLTLTVPFKQDVKINAKVPIKLPVDTTIKVNLSQTIPIKSQVPIKMDVPIKFNLKDWIGVAAITGALDSMVSDLNSGPDALVIAGILLVILLIGVVLAVIYAAAHRPAAVVPLHAPTYPANPENPVLPEQNRKSKP
jgi:hypothetical protein